MHSVSVPIWLSSTETSLLIKLLEKHGLDVIPLKLRHSKLLGWTPLRHLGIRRRGTLQRLRLSATPMLGRRV